MSHVDKDVGSVTSQRDLCSIPAYGSGEQKNFDFKEDN